MKAAEKEEEKRRSVVNRGETVRAAEKRAAEKEEEKRRNVVNPGEMVRAVEKRAAEKRDEASGIGPHGAEKKAEERRRPAERRGEESISKTTVTIDPGPVIITSTTQPEDVPDIEESDRPDEHLPRRIRALLEDQKGSPPFDIISLMNTMKVENLSIAELLRAAPSYRKILQDGLRILPREKKIMLLTDEPFLGFCVGDDADAAVPILESPPTEARICKLTVSRTGTQFLHAAINGTPIKAYLDNGCCIICIRSAERRKFQWKLTRPTSGLHLKMIDGQSPAIEGEVHNLVLTIAPGVLIPLNVVSIENLDCACILGRAFMEIVHAITNNRSAVHHFRWNNWWVVADGASGVATKQRLLSDDEQDDWDHSRPPRFRAEGSVSVHKPGAAPSRLMCLRNVSQVEPAFSLEVQCSTDPEENVIEALQEGTYLNCWALHTVCAAPGGPTDVVAVEGFDREAFRAAMFRTPDEEYAFRSYLFSSSAGPSSLPPRSPVDLDDEVLPSLKIMSWNVNGMRSLLKSTSAFVLDHGGDPATAISTFLLLHSVDVLLIQEARLYGAQELQNNMLSISGYDTWWNLCQSQKGYSGVGILARSGLVSSVSEGLMGALPEDAKEARVLTVIVSHRIAIVNVYAPSAVNNGPDRLTYKLRFFEDLRRHLQSLSTKGYPVILGGDLNVAPNCLDVHSSLLARGYFTEEEIAAFSSLLDVPLVDLFRFLHPKESGFTAWSIGKNSRRENIGFRLDHFLISPSLVPSVTSCTVNSTILGSDHAPVVLTLQRAPVSMHSAFVLRGDVIDGRHEQLLARCDWKLHPYIFGQLHRVFGPFFLDLFATPVNTQLPRYVTRFPDTSAFATDAFSLDWDCLLGTDNTCSSLYANPPWCELGRVIDHLVRTSSTRLVLIAPVWPDSLWWPDLADLSWHSPILLPYSKDLFLPASTLNQFGVGFPNSEHAVFFLCSPALAIPLAWTDDIAAWSTFGDLLAQFPPDPSPDARMNLFQLAVVDSAAESVPTLHIAGATITVAPLVPVVTPTRTLLIQDREFQVADLPEWEPFIPQLTEVLTQYIDVFPGPGETARTITGIEPMTIQLDPSQQGPLPVAHKKRWSELETRVLNEYDDKMQAAGKLEPSMSTTSALPLLVLKPDKTYRIVFNYAPIGGRIIPYVWPLEPTDVTLQKASQWRTISSFDFPISYHQIPLEKSVRYLTAVVFPRGLRQYSVAPMGWKDSAEHLARTNAQMFDDTKISGNNALEQALSLFRDDGQLGSMCTSDPTEHLYLLRRLLACLQRHTGSLGSKTFLLMRYIKLLGFTCGQGMQIPDRSKVKAVENWPPPRDQKDILAFTGFTQFFAHCIPNLAITILPLNDLRTAKFKSTPAFQKEWNSNPKYAAAMAKIKHTMTDVTGVFAFDRSRPCILAADGSKRAIGAVAGHAVDPKEDDSLTYQTKYNPCMFLGRSFRENEKNYSQPEREMLAIVYGVDKIAPYIGSRLVILTDHKAWVHLQNLPSTNTRVDRWKVRLAQLPQLPGFPKFIFRPGISQGDVDPLSRILHAPDPDSLDLDASLTEKVADPMVLPGFLGLLTLGWEPYDSIVLWLTQGKLNPNSSESEQRSIKTRALDYYVFQSQLFKRPKPGCFPRRVPNLEAIPRLLAEYHGDTSSFGHLSAADTYQLMAFSYFWHGMYDHVFSHCDSCPACSSRRKKNPSGRYALYRITPPASMFVLLGMDTVAMPPGLNKQCSVSTIIDYTSNYAWAFPSAVPEGGKIIKCVKVWCSRFGYPQWIIVDNGSYFVGGDFPPWAAKHGISLLPTSSMHPQANGKVENFNHQITMLIARRLISRDLPVARWPEVVDDACFDYNCHIAQTTGVSPFTTVFGQVPRLPTHNANQPLPDYSVDELRELRDSSSPVVRLIRETALANLAEHRQAAGAAVPRIPPRTYGIGDWVWCYKSELDSTYSTLRKVIERWDGPLRVTTTYPGGTYLLVTEQGLPYRNGRSVSHTRLMPVKDPMHLLDFVGKSEP